MELTTSLLELYVRRWPGGRIECTAGNTLAESSREEQLRALNAATAAIGKMARDLGVLTTFDMVEPEQLAG